MSLLLALPVGASALAQSSTTATTSSAPKAYPSFGTRWATLPSGPAIDPNCAGLGATGGCPGHPEGMTIDSQGRMFVASQELPAQDGLGSWNPDPGGPYIGNLIYVFGPQTSGTGELAGQFLFSIKLPGDAFPLGMQFDSAGNLYVADALHGTVLKYDAPLGPNSTPAYVYHVCGGIGADCALNGIAGGTQRPSPDGNLYLTDSIGPFVWEVNITTCHPSPAQSGTSACTSQFLNDPANLSEDCPSNGLQALSFPPDFAGNGLAFDAQGKNLFVDNMGSGIIFKYPVSFNQNGVLTAGAGSQLTPYGTPGQCGSPTAPLAGLDDMVMGPGQGGLLYVSNGGASNVAGINPKTGQIVETLGSDRGLASDGAPNGLLQPSSIVFYKNHLYVDNQANPSIHPVPPQGWNAYTKWTVSVLPVPGGGS